jgi:hypothetical protein
MAQTLDAVAEAVCTMMQNSAKAPRQALTSFASCVPAVETAKKAIDV